MKIKPFAHLSVKELEAVTLLQDLITHKGWAVLNELIEKNDVAGLQRSLLADEDILDAESLDGIIKHSWRMRWTKAKIQLMQNIKNLPQNYIDIISEDARQSSRTGDPWKDEDTTSDEDLAIDAE